MPTTDTIYLQLRSFLREDADALAALDRLEAALRPVVEGYGAHVRRDEAYYRGAAALGLCTCGGIDAVPHSTDHTADCAIWGYEAE